MRAGDGAGTEAACVTQKKDKKINQKSSDYEDIYDGFARHIVYESNFRGKNTINWIQLVLLMTDLHRWLSADGPTRTRQ